MLLFVHCLGAITFGKCYLLTIREYPKKLKVIVAGLNSLPFQRATDFN